MNTCGRCHAEIAKTYFDTYHGKVSKLGYTKTAKCYDCHGAHDIQKVTDPRSHLSRANVVATCQKCHSRCDPALCRISHPCHPPRSQEVSLPFLHLLGNDGAAGRHIHRERPPHPAVAAARLPDAARTACRGRGRMWKPKTTLARPDCRAKDDDDAPALNRNSHPPVDYEAGAVTVQRRRSPTLRPKPSRR